MHSHPSPPRLNLCFGFFSGLITNPITVEQRIVNCQIVISLVGKDVLNVDLSHISGKGIVDGDKVSIRNFLEIFAGLLEHLMDCILGESIEGMSLHVW